MGYGKADASNADRYLAIAKAFEDHGAHIEDIKSLATDKQEQEHATGLNDVGWRIWNGNYGRWIEQVDASSTSEGWWRIGAPAASPMGYGRFGRGWSSNATSGLQFRLVPQLWGGKMPSSGIQVTIAYYDGRPQGVGQGGDATGWELMYAKPDGSEARATQVLLDGKGEWKTASAQFMIPAGGK